MCNFNYQNKSAEFYYLKGEKQSITGTGTG
jgi:hypothetical protein